MTDISYYKGYRVLTIDPRSKYKIRITKTKAKVILNNLETLKLFVKQHNEGINQMDYIEIHSPFDSYKFSFYYCNKVIANSSAIKSFVDNF